MQVRVFSVVNNQKQYNTCVKQNPYLQNCTCFFAKNTPACNVSIATHYNRFIDKEILPQQKDGWIIFCHQDFEWLEDPTNLLNSLNPQMIYGPTGMQRVEYKIWNLRFTTGKSYCQLPAGPFIIGIHSQKPQVVDTLDCCCMCIHSSLIKKYNLRFDEAFDFHGYVEDFCLTAHEKGISVYAIQLNCKHYSNGTLNQMFFKCYDLLRKKHPQELFVTPLVKIRWGKNGYFPSYNTLPVFKLIVNGIILPFKTLRAKIINFK